MLGSAAFTKNRENSMELKSYNQASPSRIESFLFQIIAGDHDKHEKAAKGGGGSCDSSGPNVAHIRVLTLWTGIDNKSACSLGATHQNRSLLVGGLTYQVTIRILSRSQYIWNAGWVMIPNTLALRSFTGADGCMHCTISLGPHIVIAGGVFSLAPGP